MPDTFTATWQYKSEVVALTALQVITWLAYLCMGMHARHRYSICPECHVYPIVSSIFWLITVCRGVALHG